MNSIDLHVHSNKSDGTYTPSQLVAYALEKGLSAIALTDHDTTGGLEEAVEAAKGTVLEVVSGIELSTEYGGRDIHILGLFINPNVPEFENHLYAFRHAREIRNEKMIKNLQDIGLQISYEDLIHTFPDAVITRAHYASYLLNKGYVKNVKEAFEKYIGDYCPAFVPREKVHPTQAVSLILKAEGIPILAHPPLYHMSDAKLDALTAGLTDAGLMGIEAVYTTYSPSEERAMKKLAKKYSLLISGGSDFHGSIKPRTDLGCGFGKLFVPEEILTNLKVSQRRKENIE